MNLTLKHIGLGLVGWLTAILLQGYFYPSDNGFRERELVREVETDSIRYTLWLVYGDKGLPEHYTADIFTPVCYSDKCYPVFIDFYWDLLGNFQRYEMPKGKILTKLDHLPFEPEDYKKMQEILTNRSSLLKGFSVEDLVVGTETAEASGVDVVTGATSKTIQNDVISGAVYSCHTLWHLAHGELTDDIRSHTEGNYNHDWLLSFLQSSNHWYKYWAVDKLLGEDMAFEEPFAKPFLSLLHEKNIFVAEYVLERFPLEKLADEEVQNWFWETYLHRPYRLQLRMLEKMALIPLQKKVLNAMIEQLDKSNPEQRKKMLTALRSQEGLPVESQRLLIPFLKNSQVATDVFQILNNQEDKDKSIQAELSKFQHDSI